MDGEEGEDDDIEDVTAASAEESKEPANGGSPHVGGIKYGWGERTPLTGVSKIRAGGEGLPDTEVSAEA